MANQEASKFINARKTFKDKTRDGKQDKVTAYLGEQDAAQFLRDLQTAMASPDGVRLTVLIGRNKDNTDDRVSFIVEGAQSSKGGGGGASSFGGTPKYAFVPKKAMR